MKKSKEKLSKKEVQNIFYKTNPSGGISLIVLVITIIVVIILAAAVIISLQNNNPMVEANKARINSDVANMQAIFTNTVGKIMAENQDVVQVVGGQLYTETTGNKKTRGEATYKIMGADGTIAVEGKIIFGVGEKLGTTYYTGKELPLYGSDTKWYVDGQGLLSVEVGGVSYGEGAKTDNPPIVEEGEEIADSENPMLQSGCLYKASDQIDNSIQKIRFDIMDRVPVNAVEVKDVSQAQDKSIMAWKEIDENNYNIIVVASKEKIIANTNSSRLFSNFRSLNKIENMELLDTSQVENMGSMFYECQNLSSLNFTSNFDTSNVTSMNFMFYDCTSLRSLKLGENFDTSKVTNMSRMFYNCKNLATLVLGNKFNTDSVEKMDFMFSYCRNLTTTITIKNKNLQNYTAIFANEAATVSPAQITVNYTSETSNLVDQMIASKSENSNVVKGIQVD